MRKLLHKLRSLHAAWLLIPAGLGIGAVQVIDSIRGEQEIAAMHPDKSLVIQQAAPSTAYETVYEGCQYVNLGGGWTHKGSCTNEVHRR